MIKGKLQNTMEYLVPLTDPFAPYTMEGSHGYNIRSKNQVGKVYVVCFSFWRIYVYILKTMKIQTKILNCYREQEKNQDLI